jgi:hypothetical protein
MPAVMPSIVCTPAVVGFLRDIALVTWSTDDLRKVGLRLLDTLAHDHRLEDPEFRKEIYLLTRMIEERTAPLLPPGYTDLVSGMIGADMDDEDINATMHKYVLSPGADRDRAVHDLVLGRLLALNAYQRVCAYGYTVVQPHSDLAAGARLAVIIRKFADGCKFERKVDLYLHQMGKLHLNAERLALLCVDGEGANPLNMLPSQYAPEDLTTILLPIIDTPTEDAANSIDWEASSDVGDFVFAASMVQEMVDNDRLLVLTGPHISYHESMGVQLFVMTMNFTAAPEGFGLVHDKRLTVVDSAMPHSIGLTLLQLVRARAAGLDADSYASLLECCDAPERVSASNPFSKFL